MIILSKKTENNMFSHNFFQQVTVYLRKADGLFIRKYQYLLKGILTWL